MVALIFVLAMKTRPEKEKKPGRCSKMGFSCAFYSEGVGRCALMEVSGAQVFPYVTIMPLIIISGLKENMPKSLQCLVL